MNFGQEIKKILGKNLKFNESLKKWTTFYLGGPAKYFFLARNQKEIVKALKLAINFKIPYFIIGGGSNLLISDKGFKGLVIKIKNEKLKIKNDKEKLKIVEVGAGVSLSRLVNFSLKKGLTGLEWATGIPGTLGGAIRGNAGAYGKSTADLVETVKVLKILNSKLQTSNKFQLVSQRTKFKIQNFSKRNCQFGYRDSIFKHHKNLIIFSATLRLKKGDKRKIKNEILKILKRRKEKIPFGFSAGCIFKNIKILKYQNSQNTKILKYPDWQDFKKNGVIPAGWLIEKSGLKGKIIGQAEISARHANFIINHGTARAKDVLKLINLIKKEVYKKFKIKLKEEIEKIGFDHMPF